MSSESTYVAIVLALASVVALCYMRSPIRTNLPPGPWPIPFAGNIMQFPRRNIAASLASLSDSYGDIIYMHVFGREFLILNSVVDALELFDRRGSRYSDRPRSVMAGELVGKNSAVLFHPYGEDLKKHRRLLRTAFEHRRQAEYWEIQYAVSYKLIAALLKTPDDFMAHLKRSAAAFTMRVAYGYDVSQGPGEDHFVTLAEELARLTAKASKPGRWLVDSFPMLRYIPAWFPGAGFKRWARTARIITHEFAAAPYMYAKNAAIANGISSFVSDTIELIQAELGHSLSPGDDEFLKWTSASIYSGGTDTSVAINSSFLLMMALYPDVQRKAQAELDSVIGHDRLTRIEDRACLPYIEALIKEVHRFRPITPLAPHTTVVDDEYRGFRIPKGSWIMANTWAFMHNAKVFSQPEKFWPERFLPEGAGCTADPRDYSFGYGRRRCPGLSVAESAFFIAVTHILAVFDISHPTDDHGHTITEPVDFTDEHISHPKPFKCVLKPRSKATVDMISQLLSSSSC
ncbi:cytochrome P450 [Fomitopsis serialis]|uniref:cytochrome P450 n=1 Tax=Fomitopsis serialis TaxID=139415 RepID=UPI002008A479|nr:cytochrome P450 [Neoantrodia serialis]KAH9918445.1 cytochrome P450 [Neoantrodia serialis]